MDAEIISRLKQYGQEHLLSHWDRLNDEDKIKLELDLKEIDFDYVTSGFKKALESLNAGAQKLDSRIRPMPEDRYESESALNAEETKRYFDIGLTEIRQGHVGVILMAGGQGTRLGVTYPKGMYNIGLPSGKSLFQVQAERIRRLQQLAGGDASIPWYIMTSAATMEMTENFLVEHNYFGLRPENVVLFEQGTLPCFGLDGKIILGTPTSVFRAPDGNGGVYKALKEKGILADMKKRGVRCVHVHSVDNILVRVADPLFIGYCIDGNADCGAKVVAKRNATEPVGVVCQVDDCFQVVEYTEITESTAALVDPQGRLQFRAGNICNHFFTTAYLEQVANDFEKEMKVHAAKKKIPYVDEQGDRVKPDKPNGIKVEKFVFDAFQFTERFVVWEVPREKEFSALKNDDSAGVDCPSTARNDLFKLHKAYVTKAGGIVDGDVVEISPLLSYQGEDIEEIVRGKSLTSPVLLKASSE